MGTVTLIFKKVKLKKNKVKTSNRSHGLQKWRPGKEPICQCKRPGFNPWVGKIPWRKKWQPPPVFLPGEPHGQRRLAGYSPMGCKEPDTEELSLNKQASKATLLTRIRGETGMHPSSRSTVPATRSCSAPPSPDSCPDPAPCGAGSRGAASRLFPELWPPPPPSPGGCKPGSRQPSAPVS